MWSWLRVIPQIHHKVPPTHIDLHLVLGPSCEQEYCWVCECGTLSLTSRLTTHKQPLSHNDYGANINILGNTYRLLSYLSDYMFL